MKNKKMEFGRKILEFLFLLVFLFTMALLVECVAFQFKSLQMKEEPLVVDLMSENVEITTEAKLAKLSEEEQESIRINQENEKMIAEYHGLEYVEKYEEGIVEKDGELYQEVEETVLRFALEKPYYIKKFDLRVPLEQKGGYTVTIKNGDKETTLYCSIDPKIDAGIVNVNAYGEQFEITFLSGEEIPLDETSLTLSNQFKPNGLRVFILFSLFFVSYLLFFTKEWIIRNPVPMFAISSMLIGSAMIWGVGTNQVGYDEYVHAKSIYDLSFGTTIETTEAAMQLKGNLLPFFYTPEERALIEEYEQRNNDFSWADISQQSRMVRAENRVYYPNALGFKLARFIGADFATSVELAKFGGLICYVAVMCLAIALAERYKIIVAFIGLLPNNLFMACSLTRDMVVTSFLILGTVLLMNEFLEPERKLTWQRVLGILLAFVCGSVSKPIYIVMPLLMLFLGRKKFDNRAQEILLKLAVCIVAGLMIYDIFCPTPVATTNHYLVTNYAYAGDKRSTGTSNIGQMQYILQNPLVYTVLLLKSMIGMFVESFTTDSFINYGYLGKAPILFNWIAFVVGIWISAIRPQGEERKVMSIPNTILTLLMLFGTAAVVWTSMYISYTAVGSNTIEGVQGRYFIPLFVPLGVCLFTKPKKSRITKKVIYRVAFGTMIYMNLYMVYELVLKTMNI